MTAGQALDRTAPVRRPKDRKVQIALAAAELFCERGYHGVGIDEIAAAVGITGPAVYRHFPNKYAMLVHATRELSEAVLAATAPPKTGLPPQQRLDAILTELARLSVERRRVGGLYQWEERYLEAADRAQLKADLRVLVNRVTTPLRSLRPDLTTAQARLLAWAALSLIASLATHRAPIAPARAQQLLREGGWCLLRAPLGPAPTAGAPPAVPAAPAPGATGLLSRRETIMAAALRLFRDRGYHAVSMEDIAVAAATQASSLYRHFAGKGELLAAVYYRAADRVSAVTANALASATSHRDALQQLVDSYVELVFGQSDLVVVYQAENTNLPAHDRHELRRAQRSHVEEWVRILRALHPGLAAADCRLLAHGALNLILDLGRSVHFDRTDGADRVIAGLAMTMLTDVDRWAHVSP